MKTVKLAYGRSGLVVDLPASADTIEPRYVAAVPDEAGTLRQALRQLPGVNASARSVGRTVLVRIDGSPELRRVT